MLEDKIKGLSMQEKIRHKMGTYSLAIAIGVSSIAGLTMYGCETSSEDECKSDSDCKNGYQCSEQCSSSDCSNTGNDKGMRGKTLSASSCTTTYCSDRCVPKEK